MEQIRVRVNFELDGSVTPTAFSRQGSEITIESVGRQWQAADGLHILVIAFDRQVYHLLFAALEPAWYLIPRTGPGPVDLV